MLRLQALGIDGDADSEFTGSHTQVARALYYGTECAAGAAFWDVRELVAEIDEIPDINDIVKELGPPPPGFEAVDVLLPDHEGLVAIDHSAYLGLLELISDAEITVEEVVERYMH